MPWTAQVSESETYVSDGLAAGLWHEQALESEVYTKNERYSRIYSNDGEPVFALDGFSVTVLSDADPPWIKIASPAQSWE